MLFLNVPYSEKDEAKAHGARWNPECKKWYVESKEDYPKFAKWISEQGTIVVCDSLYVLEGKHTCFKCKKETRVIGFGFENFYDVGGESEDEMEYWSDVIRIAGPIDPVPDNILTYLQKNYNYKERYSKTTRESHLNNCCEHCDILQGDFFLFSEVDSPFFIDSGDTVKALKIYKIPLKTDLIVSASYGYSSDDELIKEYGNIEILNL